MNKIEITVKAPTSSGKSIILDRIEKAVKALGCKVYSPDLDLERCGHNFDKPLADWEQELLAKAFIELKEVNVSRGAKRFSVTLEFKPQDLWIGAFWQRKFNRQHLWICILPTLPIHFDWDSEP